jgi:hypothetical protein
MRVPILETVTDGRPFSSYTSVPWYEAAGQLCSCAAQVSILPLLCPRYTWLLQMCGGYDMRNTD